MGAGGGTGKNIAGEDGGAGGSGTEKGAGTIGYVEEGRAVFCPLLGKTCPQGLHGGAAGHFMDCPFWISYGPPTFGYCGLAWVVKLAHMLVAERTPQRRAWRAWQCWIMNRLDLRYWGCECEYVAPFGLVIAEDCAKHGGE